MQKSRLIEKIAELLNEKKLPLVGDVRDESAEDIRLVIEPKIAHGRSRADDGDAVQAHRAREPHSAQHERAGRRASIPKVVGLAEALREWLDHRRDVLLRRTNYRQDQIEHRLEVLGGYLIAYLNIDEVIKIIRTEDEPKPVLMKTFKLTDVQAEADPQHAAARLAQARGNGNPRRGQGAARRSCKGIKALLEAPRPSSGRRSPSRSRRSASMFGPKTPLGKRRTTFADAPEHDVAAIEEAMVEREPITVVVSEKGWIRALQGPRRAICRALAFKTDDKLEIRVLRRDHVEAAWCSPPTARFYTLDAAKLPGGRGHGEPIRHVHRHGAGRRRSSSLFVQQRAAANSWSPASDGQGFVVNGGRLRRPIPARASRC